MITKKLSRQYILVAILGLVIFAALFICYVLVANTHRRAAIQNEEETRLAREIASARRAADIASKYDLKTTWFIDGEPARSIKPSTGNNKDTHMEFDGYPLVVTLNNRVIKIDCFKGNMRDEYLAGVFIVEKGSWNSNNWEEFKGVPSINDNKLQIGVVWHSFILGNLYGYDFSKKSITYLPKETVSLHIGDVDHIGYDEVVYRINSDKLDNTVNTMSDDIIVIYGYVKYFGKSPLQYPDKGTVYIMRGWHDKKTVL